MSYMSRNPDQELVNRHGQKMSGEEQEDFIEKSAKHQHEKGIVISPNRVAGEQMTDEEISLAVRKNMSELVDDRPTADYCYSIHRAPDDPDTRTHVHVALTGSKGDLYADSKERQGLRRDAREKFGERDYEHQQAIQERREQRIEREREQQQDRGHALD